MRPALRSCTCFTRVLSSNQISNYLRKHLKFPCSLMQSSTLLAMLQVLVNPKEKKNFNENGERNDLISSLPWNNPEHRHGWIYLLKNPSSMFSLTVDILIRFISHFLFSTCSQIPVKILYALYISSDLTCIGLCSKSNTLTGRKQNNSPGIPWFKKRLPSLNSILPRRHSILKK